MLLRSLFSQTLILFTMSSGYQEALHVNFSFFTTEFWLSGSLSYELFFFFHDGILAFRKPFSRTLFLFHDGILAIRKPFTRTFFFFFMMEFWLSGSLSHELFFFFHDGILAIRKPFTRTFFFFHDGILAIRKPFSRTFFSFFTMEFSKCTIWGKTLFIYISQRVFT
jgi:hypothetical protein